MSNYNKSRRDFVKKSAYAVPVILTLKAAPSFARNGSKCDNGGGNGSDCTPPGLVDNENANHVDQDD